jgi:hypothetical protein
VIGKSASPRGAFISIASDVYDPAYSHAEPDEVIGTLEQGVLTAPQGASSFRIMRQSVCGLQSSDNCGFTDARLILKRSRACL